MVGGGWLLPPVCVCACIIHEDNALGYFVYMGIMRKSTPDAHPRSNHSSACSPPAGCFFHPTLFVTPPEYFLPLPVPFQCTSHLFYSRPRFPAAFALNIYSPAIVPILRCISTESRDTERRIEGGAGGGEQASEAGGLT